MTRLQLVPVRADRIGLHADSHLLAAGWSMPELSHVWSVGRRAVLRMDAGTALVDGGYLELRINPFVVEGRHPIQRVSAHVGGRQIGRASLHGPAVLWWRIPGGAACSGPFKVELEIPDAVRACDVFDCADTRELGLGLTSVRLFGFQPIRPAGTESAPEPADTRALLMAFDSLGDNCEFGLVQRRAGAEPLGLFRFAGTSITVVTEIIEADFAGLADPDGLIIQPHLMPSGDHEWLIRHRLYNFWYHTLTTTTSVSEAQMRKRESARLTLAVRRMRGILRAGDRLLLVKRNIGLDEGELMRLLAAVRAVGPATILCVTEDQALTDGAAPKIDYVMGGLIRGAIPRFAPYEDAGAADDPAWHALCAAAWRLWAPPATARGPVDCLAEAAD